MSEQVPGPVPGGVYARTRAFVARATRVVVANLACGGAYGVGTTAAVWVAWWLFDR